MTHYSTRKRTAKIIAKTKDVTDNMSNTKADAKVTNRRSAIRTRSVSVKKKINVSVSSDEEITEKENQKIVKLRRLPKEGVNNKIKSKKSVACNSSSDLNKNNLRSTKRRQANNEKTKNTRDLRQMSLKESFVNLSKAKVLRSRDNANNLKSNSEPTQEHSPKLKKSLSKKKLPVYKSVPLERTKENSNEIYEFKFDINDSKEKLPKKRKKVAVTKRRLLNKRKKNILRKRNLQETEVKTVASNVQSEEVKDVNQENLQPKKVKEAKERKLQSKKVKEIKVMKSDKGIVEKDSVESTEQKVTTESPIEHVSKELLEEDLEKGIDTHKSGESQNANSEHVKANNTKPTIVLVENLSNKRFTIMNNSNISNSDDFKPFRPTNVFKNEFAVQQKNMLNHSLFEKSLSPITKTIENPELSSPWRAPQLLTFPQIKNVFHSTPQNRKYDIVNNKFVRSSNNEKKSYGSTPNVRNILHKNDENVSGEGHVNTVNLKKKNPSVSRRFGTEITNTNHSLQSNPGESINETTINEVENIQPAAVQSANTINLDVNNTFNSDANENNENNTSNYQSQVVRKREMKRMKSQSPKKKISNVQMDEQKENLDPQPGPSGLQNRFDSNDQRILRQSNLNNFLNIMDMPQSTIIKTPHRIFEDIHSSPISSTKSVKKLEEPNMELKNAFGFIDEDSDENVECKSINDKDGQEKDVQANLENYNKPVARLSIGEIKNKLLMNKLKDDIRKEQNVITEKKLEAKKSPLKERNKNKIDIATFSDTFDVLSDMGESSIGNTSNNPLFADLEPVHFTQPPRHSYKRKRPVMYSLSGGSEDEEEEEEEEKEIRERQVKRKKGNKMKPEQEKRLIDWIDNINKTFSEVDQHELVIE